jgi:phosphoribosylformylglycinamidine (FGAM) synthase-like enzyme
MKQKGRRLLGSSECAKVLFGELWGEVPTIDLEASARRNELLVELANLRLLHSAADEGTGGVAKLISSGCLPNNIGAELEYFYEEPGLLDLLALFSDGADHVVITCEPGDVRRIESIAHARGLGCQQIGVTIPDIVKIQYLDPPLIWHLDDLRKCYSSTLESQLAAEVVTG